jgi:hypothetical protein
MPGFTEVQFKSGSLGALSLAFSLTVIAQDIPKDAARFTQYVAGQLRADLGDTVAGECFRGLNP